MGQAIWGKLGYQGDVSLASSTTTFSIRQFSAGKSLVLHVSTVQLGTVSIVKTDQLRMKA